MLKRVNFSEQLPTGYGAVYVDHFRLEVVCAPVGLNLAMAIGLSVWCFIKHPTWFTSGGLEAENKRLREQIDQLIRESWRSTLKTNQGDL